VNPNHATVNAAAAAADEGSVFHHYRRLIELRHKEPAVAHGDFHMLLPHDERVYAFTRRLEDVELLVLGNFSGEEAPADVPDAAGWAGSELLLGNLSDVPDAGPIVLRPWEARVYRRTA